jgi:hypothetical protein
MGMLAAVFVLVVFASISTAEDVAQAVVEKATSSEPAATTCPATDDVELQEVGLDLPGLGRKCLPSTRLTCDDMPIPYGGTCSCQSTLLDEKCRTCETWEKGHVLETTCTVRRPCLFPPCDIQQNITRTGRSCV